MAVNPNVAIHVFEVPEDVSVQLQALSAANSVSLGTTLTVATAALLHKYSCEGTLTVRIELGVRLLPVSRIIAGDVSFQQMLECGRQLLPDRAESVEVEILMSPEIQNELIHSEGLSIGFRSASRGLTGTLKCGAEASGESRVTRMAEHLQNFLRKAAAFPDALISQLEILGDRERRQIISEWNDTDCGYPEGSVPELIERQVERTPHAVALIQGDQRLTYNQLNEQSNRLANHLRERGVGPEVLVGLCMEQSLRTVVAIIGILKAGGAYVPLDPAYPRHRLEEMASDAGVKIAVTSARFSERVPIGIETVCLDHDSAQIAAQSSASPGTNTTPDSAAYVLYTSASTGKPKGVIGIQRSITNGLKTVTYTPNEICCLNTFLSFGFSIANLFLPIMSGVPVVILSDEQIRDVNQMMTVLETEGVTRLVLVPSVLKQILDPLFGGAARLNKITTIGVAGAKLTRSHVERLAEVMPQAKLYNRYASTEIGTVATIANITPEGLSKGEIAIGRPVANTRVYILDHYKNPVPVGVVGELYVGAPHLARGYLNRPDLTEERFIPDPFRPEAGRRLFRTGDLGRFRANGEIELVGRADDQVKMNGFRIDLPEVERALTDHIGVSEAVAAVREIGHGQRLIAYVVAKPLGTPNASQLRNYLQKRLPDYMVPATYVFLEALPVVGNGKVDRNALPLPEPVRPKLDSAYQAPAGPMEAAIAQIWSDVLGLHPIGAHDKFRDLGGDSISAAEVAVRLGGRFGMEMTPAVLLERATIAQLAVHLGGQK